MDQSKEYNYYLIRDATVLVRTFGNTSSDSLDLNFDLFDVRTGVHLKDIYPGFQPFELKRAFRLSGETAAAILKSQCLATHNENCATTKVVTIVEARQRKLDSVVADSIIDQVEVISRLLHDFLTVVRKAPREERFWLSQQVLTLVRKFSGRELSELEEILDWFKGLSRRP